MKQVININFQGRVIPIEVTAYDLLKNYIDRLNTYFANEEGKEEIINDIEDRFAELFDERIKKGSTCIVDDDVNAIIKNMGMPEDFEPAIAEEESTNAKSKTAGTPDPTSLRPKRLYRDEADKILGGVCSGIGKYFHIEPWILRILLIITGVGFLAYVILWAVLPSSSAVEMGSYRKKLFRDGENKWIGGVAGGLASYFGVSIWLPRLLFSIPFLSYAFNDYEWGSIHNMLRLSFSPGTLILYIVLWLVIPEATTKSEKMEMKGEKVDIDTIKNSVMEEMKDVQARATKMGQEGSEALQKFGNKLGKELNSDRLKKGGSGLAYIIALCFKIFGYFIIGCVAFTAIVGLFTIAVLALQALPYKNLVITDGWQNVWAWGTLLFFIATPIVGVITWIVRRIAKMRAGSKLMRFTFISLHIIGWVCAINLLVSIVQDFKYDNAQTQEIVLADPTVAKLEVKVFGSQRNFYSNSWTDNDAFELYDNDSAIIKNVEVRIFKAADDKFKVTKTMLMASRRRSFSDSIMRNFNFNVIQQDSTLQIDDGINVNANNKFRNQRVIINVYVPLGKRIEVNRNAGNQNHFYINGPRRHYWNDEENNDSYAYSLGIAYTMTAEGLLSADGKKSTTDNSTRSRSLEIGENGIIIQEEGPSNSNNNDNNNNNEQRMDNDDNYRYNQENKKSYNNTKDSLDQRIKQQQSKKRDSLLKVKEATERELKSISGIKDNGSSDMATTFLVSNAYLLSFAN